MEINYNILGPVVVAGLLLIFYLIRRNNKDEQKYEEDTIDSEQKPESHDEESY